MPGLTREEEVARLACERADASVEAVLGRYGLRLDAVRPAGRDRVAAWLELGEPGAATYRIAVPFVLAGDVDHDADAVLHALRDRAPDTWDARWIGTTDETAVVRPGIAGGRWRFLQSDAEL